MGFEHGMSGFAAEKANGHMAGIKINDVHFCVAVIDTENNVIRSEMWEWSSAQVLSPRHTLLNNFCERAPLLILIASSDRGRETHARSCECEEKNDTYPFLLQSIINLKTPCRSGTRKLMLYQPFFPFTGKTVVRRCGSSIVNSSCKSSSGVPVGVGASSTQLPWTGSQVAK